MSSPLSKMLRPLPSVGRGLIGKGFRAVHSLRRALKEHMNETRFDVVHSHSGTYPYAFVPLMAETQSCVRLHSLYCPLGSEGGVYGAWWDRPFMAKALFERLDRVIAVTNNVGRSLEVAGVPRRKVEFVPMCVDTRRFYPWERDDPSRYFPNGSDGRRVVFVGNASSDKGLFELLHAVKILIEKKIDIFVVAAIENQNQISEFDTRHNAAKQLIVDLSIEKHVTLLTLIDRIEDLYAQSDLVVIPWKTTRGPSDYPMVALEAMAMGKCVLSTPVGGCAELLQYGQAGILTEDCSPSSIASRIASVIRDPQARGAIEQAAIRRAGDFSATASANRLVALYKRLLEDKRHQISTAPKHTGLVS